MNIRILKWGKPRPPSESELRRVFEREGMKPYLQVLEKFEKLDVSQHSHDETKIVLEGEIEFCADGRMMVLKPGDRLDIKRNAPYTTKNLLREQSVMLCASKAS